MLHISRKVPRSEAWIFTSTLPLVCSLDTVMCQLHTFVAKAAPTTGLRGEPPELLEGLLRAAFASTETEILNSCSDDGDRQDGTTVTACLLVGDLLVTANVGDSCAMLGSVGYVSMVKTPP